ncbi:MAG: CBS domain-containing protein [Nocardioidaceae bacterium]
MRITQVLAGKSASDVVTVRPDATVRELLDLLAEHNIGAVVVSGDGAAVDGIVSERDVVRHLREDAGLLDSPVSAIMSSRVQTCEPHHSVDDLMAMMTRLRVRHVPVVRDGRLIGIVSIGDVVKSRMSDLEFERDQLDSYVHGSQT